MVLLVTYVLDPASFYQAFLHLLLGFIVFSFMWVRFFVLRWGDVSGVVAVSILATFSCYFT